MGMGRFKSEARGFGRGLGPYGWERCWRGGSPMLGAAEVEEGWGV